MYDNTCKFLAENFSTDFASWLLGKPIPLTKIKPSELSAEPIRADSVILLESSEIVMHLEFQTKTDETMAYRMANYWLRLYGKYPTKEIHQTVIYLKHTNSPLVYQTSFNSKSLNHNFNVIRLWEQPTEIFQKYQGLLPFAVLSQTPDRQETLRQVARQINNITDQRIQSSVAASTAIISGIALDKEIIQRLLRSEIMEESVIYQEILLEGKVKGIAEGKAKAINQIALKMLSSSVSLDLIVQFTGLTLKQIEKLQKLSAKQSKITKSPKVKKSSTP
jgi:predicted transposase/invertase (TIGR01784 family)